MKVAEKNFWEAGPKSDRLYFTDVAGTRWTLERDGRAVPGSMGARCLVCMTDVAVRRLWEFPLDWRVLAQGDLQRLVDLPRGGQHPTAGNAKPPVPVA